MTMMLAGLRRGEVLALNIDRDVDFENHTITVREALSFREGNQAVVTDGKTENARRVIPMAQPLEDALKGHHGLLCAKEKGGLMSESAFERKYQSWTTFLETKLNGCHKRWYGKPMNTKHCWKREDSCLRGRRSRFAAMISGWTSVPALTSQEFRSKHSRPGWDTRTQH